MVTFGTPFSGSTFSRISTTLSRNVILSNIRRNQADLSRVQEQLSTGLRILRPSDDPVGAVRVQDLTAQIGRSTQFVRNIETAVGRLNMSESALAEANDVLNRAREILLSQTQSTATARTRRLSAQEVNSLLQEAVNLANLRFEDRHVFGGSRTEQPPFAFVGGDVAFRGDLREFQADVADGLRAATNVSAEIFGALSAEIRGLDPVTFLDVDLNPRVTASTRLSDLNGGAGVAPGSIEITGPGGTALLDLRTARTVGDVLDLVNDPATVAATGVSASINPAENGFRLTAPGAITVREVSNGRTAADLGIAVTGAASPFDGADLDPVLSKDTLVGDFFVPGGPALDPSGIVITNQSSSQTLTATFDATLFAPGRRLEEVLNAINSSDLQVEARINEAGTGIDIVSRLSGARLSIAENGGTTAAQLGLLSTLGRSRLGDLNGGLGVGGVDGPDLRIVRKDGTTILLDVDNATTVRDVVSAIDADPDLSASIVGSSIVVTDDTAPAGTLSIENVNGSFAATNLGIAGSVTVAGGPAALAGSAVPFSGVQVDGLFTSLIRLRDALEAGDVPGINAAARAIDSAQDLLLDGRASVGSRIAGLELTRNRLDQENLELQKMRSSTRDADMAELATRFGLQQTVLEASLATAVRIMQVNIFNYL